MIDKLKEGISSYKLPVALTLLGVVLLSGGIFTSFSQIAPESLKAADLPKESMVSPEKVTKDITIDVSGAVKTPGVYHLDTDARVGDAIKLAGGFTDKVNKGFVSKQLNLASKVTDGAKLYIPFQGEATPSATISSAGSSPITSASGASTSDSGSKININSASEAELDKLPSIGAVTAAKIMSLRPYATVAEVLSKKAVSKSVYEKIKDQVEI